MSRNRVTVSFVLVVAVCAIPLMHCSTNSTTAAGGARPSASSNALVNFPCIPSSNPFAPVVCISAGGVADPDTIAVHSHADGLVPNRILFLNATGSGKLSIKLGDGCRNLNPLSLNCVGGTCSVMTVPAVAGDCTYTAGIDGAMGADPIIVTDNCCPIADIIHPKP